MGGPDTAPSAARVARTLIGVVALVLAACATAPVHPSLVGAQRPTLIPLHAFFANPDTTFDYKVSPDGTRLAWLGSAARRLTVHVKRLGTPGGVGGPVRPPTTNEVSVIDTHSRRSLQSFTWAQDSRRILFPRDHEGDENHHLFVADTERPDEPPRDLTPFPGRRAFIQQVIRGDADHVIVGLNRPRTALADLHRVNLTTGEMTPVAENPGDVVQWITATDGAVRARVRQFGAAGRTLERWNATTERWERVLAFDLEELPRPVELSAGRNALWLLSNRGRDRRALVRLDLTSGEETVVHEHPVVDVEVASVSKLTGDALFAMTHAGHQQAHFFDHALGADLAALRPAAPSGLRVLSFDDAERLVTVSVYRDVGGEFYLLDRQTRERTLLARSAIASYASSLAPMEPISFRSRDGLTVHGYLTIPRGGTGRRLPMVLLVHGGPWWRDYWGYHPTVQFLANRGYAVLQVNYRASTGYGRAFTEAAVHQHARAMHDDLIDGVQWAIARGVADPTKVAIMGASYGGYATLVGLTFTPEVFACGVDLFGMSSLVSLLEARPTYWTWSFFRPYYEKYYGDVTRPEDRRRLEAQSPLHRAHQVRRPLLIIHGANDPNVKQAESDRMVAALRQAGKEVEYLVLTGEGHGRFGDWRSSMKIYRTIEDFLAKHLGGRSGGFDLYELGRFRP